MHTEKIALTGELALGLLDKAEQERVRRDLEGDSEMRDAFRLWNARRVACSDPHDQAGVAPPPRVLSNIQNTLFGEKELSLTARFLDALRAPENRGMVLIIAVAKTALLAWILYLFL